MDPAAGLGVFGPAGRGVAERFSDTSAHPATAWFRLDLPVTTGSDPCITSAPVLPSASAAVDRCFVDGHPQVTGS